MSACSSAEALRDDELTAMFAWWNSAMLREDSFTRDAFARHFTEDGVIRVNNRELARGPDEMVVHFRGVQSRTEIVEIELPFAESFRDGEKIFTHHRVHARENGNQRVTHVMGYAVIRDGKISLIDFVTHTEWQSNPDS
jgi:hypothetical protein